jgi:hypothetical protein
LDTLLCLAGYRFGDLLFLQPQAEYPARLAVKHQTSMLRHRNLTPRQLSDTFWINACRPPLPVQ